MLLQSTASGSMFLFPSLLLVSEYSHLRIVPKSIPSRKDGRGDTMWQVRFLLKLKYFAPFSNELVTINEQGRIELVGYVEWQELCFFVVSKLLQIVLEKRFPYTAEALSITAQASYWKNALYYRWRAEAHSPESVQMWADRARLVLSVVGCEWRQWELAVHFLHGAVVLRAVYLRLQRTTVLWTLPI